MTLKNGTGFVAFEGLGAGYYSVDVVHNGDKKYSNASTSIPITVKAIPNIVASDIFVGEKLGVNVVIPENIKNNANVIVDAMYKSVYLKNGVDLLFLKV